MNTAPIIFIIFKRFDLAQQVFDRIALEQPKQLFIVADGPRHEKEVEACQKTRSIIDKVDWNCDLMTLFHNRNLGSPYACSQGISWAFKYVDRAIILEDDCLPHSSFFEFCSRLLDNYYNHSEVMHISGSNFVQDIDLRNSSTYHFSKYTSAWGWATWKRAWQHFDLSMSEWPTQKQRGLLKQIGMSRQERKYWNFFFDRVSSQKSIHWDYAWQFSCWRSSGVAIVPNVNLVSNIGFREDASHTHNPHSPVASLPTSRFDFKDMHLARVAKIDDRRDQLTFKHRYASDYRSTLAQLKVFLYRVMKNQFKRAIKVFPYRKRQNIIHSLKTLVMLAKISAFKVIRQFHRPAIPKNENGRVYLHLGCGQVKHPAFINIDLLPYSHVHYVRSIGNLGMIKNDAVDLVYASHCLEHFPFKETKKVLSEWFRVLKRNGVLRLSVPDFDLILSIYQNFDRDIHKIIRPLFGGQDYLHNFHHSTFNFEYLSSILQEVGFHSIRPWQPGSSYLTSFNDWASKELLIDNQSFPISLNLEARK